jgi:hypothetical protein
MWSREWTVELGVGKRRVQVFVYAHLKAPSSVGASKQSVNLSKEWRGAREDFWEVKRMLFAALLAQRFSKAMMLFALAAF